MKKGLRVDPANDEETATRTTTVPTTAFIPRFWADAPVCEAFLIMNARTGIIASQGARVSKSL